ALVLNFYVAFHSVRSTKMVNLYRVVNYQFGRGQRIDESRVPTEITDCLTHSGQVNNTRYTGEVLHENTCRGELNLGVRLSRWIPVCQGVDLLFCDVFAIFVTKQIL